MYEMTVSSESILGMLDTQHTLRVFIKSDRARIDITTEGDSLQKQPTIIIRFDKDSVWFLYHDEQEYDELSMDELRDTSSVQPDSGAESISEINISETGKTKVIMDIECREILLTMAVNDTSGSADFKQTMWVANDFRGFEEIQDFTTRLLTLGLETSGAASLQKQAAHEFKKKALEVGGWPFEVILDIAIGVEEMTITYTVQSLVTMLEYAPIHANVFELPDGFALREE